MAIWIWLSKPLQHGASDFINKPVRNDALTISLERAKEKVAIKTEIASTIRLSLETRIDNATEDLRRQSEFLSKLISSSDNGIIASDEHGYDHSLSIPEQNRIFGYSASEVVGNKKPSSIFTLTTWAEQFRRRLC